jgi:hypothetical protein
MLTPQLKLVGIADDATSITVQDNTGAYSSTNTGGFGAPNPTQGSISGVILVGTNYKNLNSTAFYRLSTDERTALFGNGAVLTADKFSGITYGNVFTDGVYDFKYNILFSNSGTLACTAGTKEFTLTNADVILADAVGIIFADLPSIIYYIDKSKPLTNTGGFVTTTFITTQSGGFELALEGDLKLLVDKAGYSCWVRDIGLWAEDDCALDNFRDVWTRYKMRIAMSTKFSNGMYYDSHNLAVKLAKYCSPHIAGGCGCN